MILSTILSTSKIFSKPQNFEKTLSPVFHKYFLVIPAPTTKFFDLFQLWPLKRLPVSAAFFLSDGMRQSCTFNNACYNTFKPPSHGLLPASATPVCLTLSPRRATACNLAPFNLASAVTIFTDCTVLIRGCLMLWLSLDGTCHALLLLSLYVSLLLIQRRLLYDLQPPSYGLSTAARADGHVDSSYMLASTGANPPRRRLPA